MTAAPQNKLRILVLTDEGLVPDGPRAQLEGRERELKKTEYDVMSALKLGHETSCVGLGEDLTVVARALRKLKPHVTFNLVEEFDGDALLRPARRRATSSCASKSTPAAIRAA